LHLRYIYRGVGINMPTSDIHNVFKNDLVATKRITSVFSELKFQVSKPFANGEYHIFTCLYNYTIMQVSWRRILRNICSKFQFLWDLYTISHHRTHALCKLLRNRDRNTALITVHPGDSSLNGEIDFLSAHWGSEFSNSEITYSESAAWFSVRLQVK